MKRTWIRRILTGIVIVMVVALSGFVIWAGIPAGALMDTALAALESDADVTVTTEPWLTFTPDTAASTGLIFYPGGRVLPEAYAPALREIAGAGYLVVAPAMPLNLAVFSPDKAAEIIAAHPEIEHWAVAGHSLGGSMAANFARWNPDAVEGIALWASYPQDSDSLAQADIEAVSVSGTLDGLAMPDKIEYSRVNLPDDTVFVAIEGGNHAQFGDYGDQSGDNTATISRADQQAQTVAATLDLLAAISE